jgi:MYXO-CTERM domain-containing protein
MGFSTPSAAKPVTSTDPGGTQAEARFAGLDLLVGPPVDGKLPTDPSKALLTLEAGVADAQSQSTAAPSVDLAGTPSGRLAFTGGPGPWPATGATVLAVAGLVLRRRRRAARS